MSQFITTDLRVQGSVLSLLQSCSGTQRKNRLYLELTD